MKPSNGWGFVTIWVCVYAARIHLLFKRGDDIQNEQQQSLE